MRRVGMDSWSFCHVTEVAGGGITTLFLIVASNTHSKFARSARPGLIQPDVVACRER